MSIWKTRCLTIKSWRIPSNLSPPNSGKHSSNRDHGIFPKKCDDSESLDATDTSMGYPRCVLHVFPWSRSGHQNENQAILSRAGHIWQLLGWFCWSWLRNPQKNHRKNVVFLLIKMGGWPVDLEFQVASCSPAHLLGLVFSRMNKWKGAMFVRKTSNVYNNMCTPEE